MTDLAYMRHALDLARQGVGLVSPGALVGAVLVNHGNVVGEGFYTYGGVDHAEIRALGQARSAARGSTLYVSLEPCSHTGRTPPCAHALIEAGVRRVVVASKDPNPRVNGKGIEMLRAAGVEVVTGVLEEDANRLNEAFFVYVTDKRPFGILKLAMTLDGKIATASGESRWITSETSRSAVQTLRHGVDAIVTGSGTFLKDRPLLTDRTGLQRRRDLLRVVLDRRGRVQPSSGLEIPIVLGGAGVPAAHPFSGTLYDLQHELYAREIQSFLLECGPDLAFNAVRAGIVDKIVCFVAPKLLGGAEVLAFRGDGIGKLAEAIDLYGLTAEASGPDLICTAYIRKIKNH
jgi:diaminohydroxyphosphoribosylaminopyrimidine deaminase/5-amino-6-(5-phosphoribosylamino)uracil reductase